MDWWEPPKGEKQLLEWWQPLIAAARAAREEQVPWIVAVDEFVLVGKVRRKGKRAVWTYRHLGTGRPVCADDLGRTYRYTPSSSDPKAGRFSEIDARTAVEEAGLPTWCPGVRYEEAMSQHPSSRSTRWTPSSADAYATYDGYGPSYDLPLSPPPAPSRPRERRRRPVHDRSRGHLRLLSS